MKDIVLGTDGSKYSMAAARFIHEGGLLQEGGKIHVVHVSIALTGLTASFVGEEGVAAWHADESAKAIEPVAKALRGFALPYQTHALVGHPPNKIVDLANTIHAKMIVLGAHGRGAFLEAVIGSVASRVLALTKCPVLLVKMPGKK